MFEGREIEGEGLSREAASKLPAAIQSGNAKEIVSILIECDLDRAALTPRDSEAIVRFALERAAVTAATAAGTVTALKPRGS